MLQIDTSSGILINWQDTGLKIAQRRDGTVIYTPESLTTGVAYCEHKMPYSRYSSAHDAPRKPGASYDPNVCAGAAQLESDVLDLLVKIANHGTNHGIKTAAD